MEKSNKEAILCSTSLTKARPLTLERKTVTKLFGI